ncbi:hypothetical protein D3C86_1949310 [compost metagenome]
MREGGQRADLLQRRLVDLHAVPRVLAHRALVEHALQRLAGGGIRPAQLGFNLVVDFARAERLLFPQRLEHGQFGDRGNGHGAIVQRIATDVTRNKIFDTCVTNVA